MGALAPVTPWIPEDDLLLKNAVEAGASLESLAKGAVQFSRRFTIRELQDRWHSLLYDPIISAEASVRMIEFERSASSLPSKSNRADNSKENKYSHGKRKAESVRRCYYAMRKRICNEPLNQGDLSYLVAPGDSCFINGAEAPAPNNMLGDPIADHYGLEDANFDHLHHVFPQVMRKSAPTCGVGEFPIEHQNMLEDPVEKNNAHKEIPHMLRDNMAVPGSCNRVGQMDSSKELPGHNIFEASGVEVHPVCSNKAIVCSGFGGNQIFNSPSSDCETSLHHLQYTSPPSAMPDWKAIEGNQGPEIPGDGNVSRNNVQTGDPFGIHDDGAAGKATSEYDVIHTEPQLNNHISCDDLKNSTSCTAGYFAELSSSLFQFTSEDELLIINDGKDVIDKSYLDGLSSLLLNSPDDVNEDQMTHMPETKQQAASDSYLDIPSITGPEETNNDHDMHLGDTNLPSNLDTQIPACASSVNPQFPELRDDVICCTLNTEDPEIPCNDDIVFPSKPRPVSAHRRSQIEASNPSLSGKDNTGNQVGEKGSSTTKKEPKRFGESHPASQTRGPDSGLNRAIDELGVKFESSRGESLNGSRDNTGFGGPSQSVTAKKEPSELPLVRQPGSSLVERPSKVSDVGRLQNGVSGINREGQTLPTIRNQEYSAQGSADPMGTEPREPILLDPEEQLSESDADIPYFSDIESMILDMDLGPDDQDSFCSMEVAKYQHENAKRAIIRLEQNAHSYMQRAIAAHGAFAILYGRHSKHYIKKAEVLLGRATDDVIVDIDLGREGRANKISRRQAIIMMDKDGTFNVKNLGKCSIYVNSKEIFPGQCLGLHSNCLIEIRGMPFIFETNQVYVKRYLDNATQKLQAKALNV